MAISSAGIGSGLDVNSIVTQLMAIERQPLNRLDQKEAQYQAEISGYGSLKSALSSLQTSLDKLKESSTFRTTAGASSDSDVFSVSTDIDAVPSTYDITVNRLAQKHKLGASEFASATTFGGGAGDELTISVGTDQFTVDLSTAQTLSEIQAAINVTANETGVTAGIITGDNGNQTLILTSGESGFDNRVQLSYGGTIDAATFNFSTFNRDVDGLLLGSDTELDASLLVDGITITRGSNTVSDVVENVTFSLKGIGRAEANITHSAADANSAMEAFVEAYNGLNELLGDLSSGSLSGNRILISIETQIRGVLNHSLSNLGSVGYISELGITTNKDTGALEFDSDMLASVLESNLDGVDAFFSDENGFAARLDAILEGYRRSDGLVDTILDGVNDRIRDIDRSRDSLEQRLVLTEQRIRAQFTSLDVLMGELTSTSNYLTTQLSGLENLFLNRS